MATPTAVWSTGEVTLTGTTVDTVTLSGNGLQFMIRNVAGATKLVVTTAGDGGTAATPVDGPDVIIVPAGREYIATIHSSTGVQLKVLGNANTYLIERVA